MNYECMRCTKRNSRGSWIIIKRSFASGDYMHRHLFHIKNMKMKKNKQIANILTTLRAKRSLPLSFPFSVFARAHVAFVDHQYNSSETFFRVSFVEQGYLPLALIFDYPETNLGPGDIENLSIKFGVFIAVRTKSRQSTSCVVIKGMEKFVGKLSSWTVNVNRIWSFYKSTCFPFTQIKFTKLVIPFCN